MRTDPHVILSPNLKKNQQSPIYPIRMSFLIGMLFSEIVLKVIFPSLGAVYVEI